MDEHSLLDIAERSGLPFTAIHDAAELLLENNLLSLVEEDGTARNGSAAIFRRRELATFIGSFDETITETKSVSMRSRMKILLTGHKGYIGAVAAPVLRSAGHEVVGLDADLFAGCDFGDPAPEIPEVS